LGYDSPENHDTFFSCENVKAKNAVAVFWNEKKSGKVANKNTQKLTSIALGAFGLAFLGAAVFVWFTGSHRWHVLGIKISLSDWWKPWWIGTGILVMRSFLTPRPRGVVSSASDFVRKVFRWAGIDLDQEGMPWAAWGLFIGTVAGFYFSIHYYYLAPSLALRIIITFLSGLASALTHWLFPHLVNRALEKFPHPVSAWRSGCLMRGLYIVIWSFLITGPLMEWEARGTEPVVFQGIVGVATGLAICWLSLAKWRMAGLFGIVRRWSAAAALLAAALISAASWYVDYGKTHPSLPPRDRVLLITVDTTRADYLSCYGYPRLTSPNLDALAASGARFTRAFCPMGLTDPSHATILTGAYPRTHGLTNVHFEAAPFVGSLAEVFQDRGYHTAAITSRQHLKPSDMNILGYTDMSGPALWMLQNSGFEVYRRVANILYRHRDQNLFIWAHFFDPHHPYQPHPGLSEHFLEENRGPRGGQVFLDSNKKYSDDEIKYRRDLYAGEIYYMDYWIGRLVELTRTLEPVPQRPPFILVIADHGEAMGEYQERPIRYGFGHGGLLLNGVVHIPFIVNWPGMVPAGAVLDDVAEAVDVAPTILDYIFDHREFPTQGMSLRRIIKGEIHSDQLAVIQRQQITNRPERPWLELPQYALIKNNMKLLTTQGGEVELYDLSSDWDEEKDLSESRPDHVRTLTEDLQRWMERIPESKQEESELSPSEINALRALGYLQ
jgi:arylsulfatase A-like enzyme